MAHGIPAGSLPRRRTLVAVLAAAALGVAAYMAAAPATASAAYGVCGAGDFCLYWATGEYGGLYHYGGSDGNLDNDHFEGAHTDQIVGNNTESVWNHGVSDPSGYNDVLVYRGAGPSGAAACIPLGARGDLPTSWWNDIEGYKWVTRATCNAHPRLALT
jgi:hypothetical protein